MESNQEIYDPQKLIALLPIRTYHIVANIGSKSDLYTIALGKYLFDGKVFAIDPIGKDFKYLQEKLDVINLTNIETIAGLDSFTKDNVNVLDGALIAFSINSVSTIKKREAFLKSISKALKKGGWAAIIEWNSSYHDNYSPPMAKRITKEDLDSSIEKAGFRSNDNHDLDGKYYMKLLRK
jgi:ubiquinone/menaquinone biosynthesis C-methylase UbiE